jgi:hypothetical protein
VQLLCACARRREESYRHDPRHFFADLRGQELHCVFKAYNKPLVFIHLPAHQYVRELAVTDRICTWACASRTLMVCASELPGSERNMGSPCDRRQLERNSAGHLILVSASIMKPSLVCSTHHASLRSAKNKLTVLPHVLACPTSYSCGAGCQQEPAARAHCKPHASVVSTEPAQTCALSRVRSA